jgi:glycosyltransferase involved in cell wall biosynthesis
MRVLMISGDNQVVKGNDGPFSMTLNGLSQHWDEIDVLCPGCLGKNRSFNSKVNLYGTRKFLLIFDLIKQLRTKKYDLIVSHDYGLMINGLCAFIAGKILNIPHISEIHHIEGFPKAVSVKEFIYSIIGKLYVLFIVRTCKAIRIDNKHDIYRLIKSLFIPEEKILYLNPIYLDLNKYRPLKIEKKDDLLFVGRLAKNKGIFSILEAVNDLKNQGAPLSLRIKGNGPLKNKIQDYISHNQLGDLVQLDSRILDEEKLVELYNQAKILICASTVEGGPRVTLEAMACEVPVISTPCGIMPTVIQHETNGFLFDGSVKQLVSLLHLTKNNPELLSKISKEGRKSVLQFDYHLTLENYALSYKNVIKP